MSGNAPPAAELLTMADGEFDTNVQEMSTKGLLETIGVLQKEMSREQENFNSLSAQLGSLKKNSGQYKSVNKEMARSNNRLTLLMNRSMKCFSQQGNQSKAAVERRNSFNKSAKQPETVVRRSQELPGGTKQPSNGDTRASVQPSNAKEADKSSEQVQSVRTSFSELKNKFGGIKSQTDGQIHKSNSNHNVSSTVVRAQSPTAPVRRPKSGEFSSSKVWSVGANPQSNTNNAATGSPKASSLGPIASQHTKFISKSTDNVFSKPVNSSSAKPEVVQGFKSTKPKTMIVMNADKQHIDLDSFTDRKNLLSELKSFDKELKPVAKSEPVSLKCIEIKPKNTKSSEVKNDGGTMPVKKSLLGDIRQGKKPSDLKETKYQVENKQNGDVRTVKSNGINASETNRADTNTDAAKLQQFDDLLRDVDDMFDDNAEENVDSKGFDSTDAVSSEMTLDGGDGSSQCTEESEDSRSQSSGVSEDEDRFVTEFQFSNTHANLDTGAKPKKAIAISDTTKPVVTPATQVKSPPVVTPATQVKLPPVVTPATQVKSPPVVTPTPQVKSPPVVSNGTSSPPSDQKRIAIPREEDYDEAEELVTQTRVNLTDWDPTKLLSELYKVTMMPDQVVDISHKFIGMEGLMEKLPMNKKKATLLKTWKRRFFRAQDGWLHYFETTSRDKPSDSLQLMGGKIEELGPRVLGVDDGRGKYLMVRVPTDHEFGQWKVALESQTADNVKATYVRPAPVSIPHPKKKVLIIDMGSSGIRAGVLKERPTLPEVFFPSIVAVHKQTGQIIVGADALRPDVRKVSNILHPIRPTNKVDKFNIDMEVMTEVFKKVFRDLKVKQQEYLVMISTPQNLGDRLKEGLMRILVNHFHVRGVCMVQQALLALYSYNAMSGVIVDIGERLEIMPIYDGMLIEGGVSRQAYGGTKIQDSLHIALLENKYRYSTPVERLIVRHICEQACYVCDNYKEVKATCDADSSSFSRTVDLQAFALPAGAHQCVSLDYARFKSPEGFFNTDLWEMDYKNIQKQIYLAIQQCPMDARKHMYRSVYLSGGVTMTPGFADRLQVELKKLAPPSVVVEVHASPQRYHAAYIGACSVAAMDVFEMSCVTAEEWNKMGVKACRKWGTS